MEPPDRALRVRPADVALAIGAAVLAILGAWITGRTSGEPALTFAGAALLVLGAAPLAWSRRWPMTASLATGFFTVVYGIAELPDPPFPVAPVVSLYVVARRCSRRTTLIAAGIVLLVTLVAIVLAGDSGPDDVYAQVLPTVVALVLGDQARLRTAAAARAHEAEVDAALEAERARLARELHDIVAHHVSMVVVQAEAGAAVTEASGDAGGTERFDEIADSSRAALGELRLLLDVLRDPDDGAPTSPQPTLADLPALVARVRRTGTEVDLVEVGDALPLSPTVALAAYRIVQEGLTNVVRHAPGATARVEVRWAADRVELAVGNGPGSGGTAGADGRGRGLIGVRERAELVGGRMSADPRPDGGFDLAAVLPCRAVAP